MFVREDVFQEKAIRNNISLCYTPMSKHMQNVTKDFGYIGDYKYAQSYLGNL